MQANNFIWCWAQETTFCSNSKGKLAVWGFLIDSIYIQNHVYIILEEIFQRQF